MNRKMWLLCSMGVSLLLMVVSCSVARNSPSSAFTLYVSPHGKTANSGSASSPLTLQAALDRASARLKNHGLPAGGITINVMAGQYFFQKPFHLGPEFQGSPQSPIVIQALPGAEVMFDGSQRIDAQGFAPVTDPQEKKRLAQSAADKILVTSITDPALIAKFNEKLMLSLAFNQGKYLPAVFPNQDYAKLKVQTVTPEICPPGVPVGKQGYGIRAGNPPYQEPGKSQNWKGTLKEPRGARVGIADKENEMAGTWQQWQDEIGRNNTRNQLTGFIEANWLLSSQPIYAASGKDRCLHLTRALGYGWAWRKDKPFRVFGLLCELDQPGEWHFDTLTNRFYLYPPQPLGPDTQISLSVAKGFIILDRTAYVSVIGLSAQNIGSQAVYKISGHHNLVAGCTIRTSPATGIELTGTHNGAIGCDLVDLNTHVKLLGGVRSPTEITSGFDYVENCHIYQKDYTHEKVNIVLEGVGNRFRRNLVHNSIGQAMVINGNDHLVELNEFFNVGFDEGDGGAMYSGADMAGYGNLYRYNFFHHLMHCPGKVERSGIHFDDLQAGSTCIGNIFYKSAAKGIFYNGGAGHVARDNIFLEGNMGIYNVGAGSQKNYDRQEAIFKNPHHMYANTKENYIGRIEKFVGKEGWLKDPWRSKYPLFNKVMSDTGQYGRYWPVYCDIENNYYYKNSRYNKTLWSRVNPEAMKKTTIKNDQTISPEVFVDYENLNLQIKPDYPNLPRIPFDQIGLRLDKYRHQMPDKTHYRRVIKDYFKGIPSMPGTHKKIDTAKVVETGPIITR